MSPTSAVPSREARARGSCPLVGCNPTYVKNGRSGASPIPGFVLPQKCCSPIRLQNANRHVHALCSNYITYTSIHNYYITVQNISGYRGWHLTFCFSRRSGFTQLAAPPHRELELSLHLLTALPMAVLLFAKSHKPDPPTSARIASSIRVLRYY